MKDMLRMPMHQRLRRTYQQAALVVLGCLLMVAQVLAQTSVPPTPVTPAPITQGEIASAIHETNQLAEKVGTSNVISLILAVGAVVVTAGYILRVQPSQSKSQSESNAQLVALTKQNNDLMQDFLRDRDRQRQHEQEADAYRRGTVEAQVKVATILSDMETRTEAFKRQQEIQANSDRNTASINAHITETVRPVAEAANQTLATLSKLEAQYDTLVTKTGLAEQLKPLEQNIHDLRQIIENELLKRAEGIVALHEPDASVVEDQHAAQAAPTPPPVE